MKFLLSLLLFAALPAFAADKLSAEDIRTDFTQLYETLRDRDPSLFAHLSEAQYQSLYRASLDQIFAEETLPQMARRFQLFLAAGGTSLTRIEASEAAFRDYLAKGGRAFPLDLKLVHGRYYVAENLSGIKGIQQGEEIYALNREPIRAVFARAARNLSADTAYIAETRLESDFPMTLWLDLGPSADHVELTFARKKALFHKVVLFLTEAQMAANARSEPAVLQLDAHRKAGVSGAVGYLRPGPLRDLGDSKDEFDAYLDRAFVGLETREAQILLIDLRDNPGGEDGFAAALLARFAGKRFRLHADGETVEPHAEPRFSGKVYLLINRKTRSTAAVLAAAAQDQRLAVVVGEKTADLVTGPTAAETFTLDKSGLVVEYPTRTMIRPAGETAARDVIPDLLIDTPVIETPDDPVLREALERVAPKTL